MHSALTDLYAANADLFSFLASAILRLPPFFIFAAAIPHLRIYLYSFFKFLFHIPCI